MRRLTLPIALCFAVLLAASLTGATYSAFFAKTNSANTFATAATFGPACPTTTPSTFWMSGLEAGKINNVNAMFSFVQAGVNDALDSAVKRSGTYSIKIAPAGAQAYRTRNMPAGTRTAVARFAIRLATLPAADVKELYRGTTVNSTALRLGYKASTQRFTLSFGTATTPDATTLVESTMTVTAGTWYVVDLRHVATANPNAAHWRIDGTPQASTSKAVVAADFSSVHWGSSVASAPFDTYTANFDDMLISTTSADYPIGDGRILPLKPNASGTHNNPSNLLQMDATTTPVDTTAWNRLDDVPLDGLTDYVKQAPSASGGNDYAEIGFENPPETCIRAVRGYMTYDPQNGATANNGKTFVRDGTTDRLIHQGAMTATGTAGRTEAAMVPPTTTTWTQSAVSALTARIGYSTSTTTAPRWTALLLEYDAPQ